MAEIKRLSGMKPKVDLDAKFDFPFFHQKKRKFKREKGNQVLNRN